jgi:hypothetical protein
MTTAPRRPQSVKAAIVLMVATLALGFVRTILRPLPNATGLPSWFAPVVVASTFVIMALLVLAIAFGRFWALIVFAILFVIGLPSMIAVFRAHPVGGTSLFVMLLQTLGQGAALVLLFLPTARAWFRAARAVRAA